MTKNSPELRQLIQASYSMTKGNWDIYIAFYEKGFGLLGSHGVLSYITPDKWISKSFGDAMRSSTTDKIFSILKAGREVFENVNVDAIVTVFTKQPQQNLHLYDYAGTEVMLKRVISKTVMKPPYAYDWLFSDFVDLLANVDKHKGRLSELGVCENACATSDAYKLKEFIEELPARTGESKYLRIVNTGTIGKYVAKWGQREMVYLGNRYTHPVVNKKDFLAAFGNSYGRKAIKRKLIVKGLNLLDACLDLNGNTIPGKTTLIVASDDQLALKLLLAIINSSLAFFYIKEKYVSSSYNGGTTFTKEMINDFPIPAISAANRTEIVSAVDSILVAKQHGVHLDTTRLEREIDRLIFVLYDLSPEQCDVVERATSRRTTRLEAVTQEVQ